MINIINMYFYYNIKCIIIQLNGGNMIIGICGKSGSGKSSLTNNSKVILDWILLPITKYFNMCDIKVLLDVPTEIRKYRTIKRMVKLL